MNKLMVFGLMLAYAVLTSGCASMMATSYHNNTADSTSKVIKSRLLSGGEPAVGIDWAAITPGYVAAWKSSPGMMTGATAIDLGTGIGAYYGIRSLTDKGGSDKSAVEINGDGNNVNYNSGSGTQTTSTDNSNKTGP